MLWWTAALVATVIAYQPKLLVTLLWIPLLLAGTIVVSLLAHIILAYYADNTLLKAKRTDLFRQSQHDPVVPLLSIATPAGLEAIKIKRAWTRTDTSYRQPLHPTSLKVSAALDDLLATILKNHLLSWYTLAISPSDPSFPNAVENAIRGVLVHARDFLSEVDWSKLGVSTLLPRITTHLELFLEAQQSLLETSSTHDNDSREPDRKGRSKKKLPGATVASEELDLLLANKYAELAGNRGLHPAVSGTSLNSRPSEEKHLRDIVLRLLRILMPEREAASPAVMTMATEIVACAIIRPVVEALSDPDLWNRLIDEKAGAIIREQYAAQDLIRPKVQANPSFRQTHGK